MPTISVFYGIIITLYFFDNQKHQTPHFHARYQSQQASVSIPDGEVLEGEIPSSKMKLVQAWLEIHKEDLLADWELAVNGQTPFPIEPLR
ncbi:hypothetical protein DSOUD_2217 [Desulfuromonas soudanensis]|uniref:DUF4160 domain-containing protein n=1 Tax=Desulfuromonas soudanensis TaxID=1603606 RepID=A0A0M4DJ03_9BACT|nr:DUF4160 domain-containing protein [Desulfuromonas soudanensis]ALC16982.1 hypothetical protein DSOUD_2217 [Desulfuromonas soudanensis]